MAKYWFNKINNFVINKGSNNKNSIISENNINNLQEKWEEKDIFNKLLEK